MKNTIDLLEENIDLEYYQELSKKHCQTVLDEINCYQPKVWNKLNISPEEYKNLSETQRKKAIKNVSEEKWKAQLYNRDTFLRLYELAVQYQHAPESNEIFQKLILFYNKNRVHNEIYRVLWLDFEKFNLSIIKVQPQIQKQIFNNQSEWEE